MAARAIHSIIRYVRGLAEAADHRALSDRQLLARFVREQDEAAFAVLVRRHGPLVFGACRRALPDPNDAEDVFQATFLILAQKAGVVGWRESAAGWLLQTSLLLARKARHRAMVRRQRETLLPDVPDRAVGASGPMPESRSVLDEELARLPEKHRAVVVLCYVEGLTQDEAARQLGCGKGVVRGRLERSRDLLRRRLERRGLCPATGALMVLLTEAAGPVPAALLKTTAHVAALFAANRTPTALVSASALSLVQGALRSMMLHKVKLLGAGVLALALMTGGVVVLDRAQADDPAPAKAEPAPKATPSADRPALTDDARQKLWEALASNDDAEFSRALLRLAASPKETVAFLKDRVKPVAVDAARVEQLLKEMDSKDFPVRTRAEEELEYLGKFAKPLLDKALKEDRPLEVKKRVQDLVAKLPKDKEDEKKDPAAAGINLGGVVNQNVAIQIRNVNGKQMIRKIVNGVVVDDDANAAPLAPLGPSPLWLRAVRVAALLEVIGTPEARQVLENLGKGEAEALPTKAAKEALDRLAGK
jgi:RNA polymerase sigma factor (sigma-70 family)